MAGGHVVGVCMHGGSVCGRGGVHAWQGGCMARGTCVAGGVHGRGGVRGRGRACQASHWNAFLFVVFLIICKIDHIYYFIWFDCCRFL